MLDTREALEKEGLEVEAVSVGGTHNYEIVGAMEGITEVQVGSYPLMDYSYCQYRTNFRPAAKVLATVVSRPTEGSAVVDAGHKTIGPDKGLPVLDGVPGATLTRVSAEHGVIEMEGEAQAHLDVGSKVWLVPWSLELCVNQYNYFHAIRDGKLDTVWEITPPGEGRTSRRVMPLSRGHYLVEGEADMDERYRPSPGTPLAELDTPCLIVDMDALENNMRVMSEFYRDRTCKLRPHVKNHKSPIIAHMQMQTGGTVGGVCSAKVAEAEVMVQGGIRDVFITNQVVTGDKISRLCALANQAEMIVACDNPRNARDLSEGAQAVGATLGVIIEVETGLRRCGVQSPDQGIGVGEAD